MNGCNPASVSPRGSGFLGNNSSLPEVKLPREGQSGNESFIMENEEPSGILEDLLSQHRPLDIVQFVIRDLERRINQLKVDNRVLKESLSASMLSLEDLVIEPGSPSPEANREKELILTCTSGSASEPVASATVSPLKCKRKEELQMYGNRFPSASVDTSANGITQVDNLKKNVHRNILNSFDVADFYHTHGCMVIFRAIATSHVFFLVTTLAIVLNAVWISVDVDVNGKKALQDKTLFFFVGEISFFGYFLLEWLIRFLAFKQKSDCFKDAWFVFDSVLIVLNAIDVLLPVIAFALSDGESSATGKTSILRLLRLVKLTKMARVARILQKWPELQILVKGLFIACRSAASTVTLLVCLVYVCAMFFRQVTDGGPSGATYFKSVPYGMKTLLLAAALPEVRDIIEDVGEDNIVYGFMMTAFFFVATLTIMNMLVGVLVEIIGVVSAVERDAMKLKFVKEEIMYGMKEGGIEVHRNMVITKQDFEAFIMKPAASKTMRSVGVDPVALVELCDYIFSGNFHGINDKDGITFQQFVELVLELGGTNPASVRDVVDTKRAVITQLDRLEENIHIMLEASSREFQNLTKQVNNLQAVELSDKQIQKTISKSLSKSLTKSLTQTRGEGGSLTRKDLPADITKEEGSFRSFNL